MSSNKVVQLRASNVTPTFVSTTLLGDPEAGEDKTSTPSIFDPLLVNEWDSASREGFIRWALSQQHQVDALNSDLTGFYTKLLAAGWSDVNVKPDVGARFAEQPRRNVGLVPVSRVTKLGGATTLILTVTSTVIWLLTGFAAIDPAVAIIVGTASLFIMIMGLMLEAKEMR